MKTFGFSWGIIPFVVLFIACQQQKEIPRKPSDRETAFNTFLKRQRIVDLPLYINTESVSEEGTTSTLESNSDTLFFGSDLYTGSRVFGLYRDTSRFYLFIILQAAEDYIPSIITFDKRGNKISSTSLLVSGCGGGCGYSCSANAKIDSELKFWAGDSVLSFECDSLGKEVPGTREHYVEYITGYVDPKGKIYQTAVIKKDWND